jgi:D-alanine-D-alanine ligase
VARALKKISVVFDTPWRGWNHQRHLAQLEKEVAAWDRVEPEQEYQVGNALLELGYEVDLIGLSADPAYLLERLREFEPQLVFNVAENFRGRDDLDYVVTAILDAAGVPYTGSPTFTLQLTRNKALSKMVLAQHDVSVPQFETFPLGSKVKGELGVGFPAIVKPINTDASAGIALGAVVTDLKSCAARVAHVHHRFKTGAIVEQFIDGRELYMGMVARGTGVQVLPPTELVFDKSKTEPSQRIATRHAKWQESYRDKLGIKNEMARRLKASVKKELERVAIAAYDALELRDFGRLDVRLTDTGQAYVLEANANPYLSYGHEMARAAAKVGLEYTDFIHRLVQEAWRRHKRSAAAAKAA